MVPGIGSQSGVRRLNFGEMGGGRGKEILLGAALASVVLVALGVSLWHIFTPDKPEHETHHLKCTKCGYEWVIRNQDLKEDQYEDVMLSATIKVDCPDCGAKRSCFPMDKCPNPECRKWYLVPEEDQKICPYCGTDKFRYLKKMYAEKKKKK